MPLSGSKEFIDDLLIRPFQSAGSVLKVMNGCDVSGHALFSSGFLNPILVPEKDGLRIRIPSTFIPSDLLSYIEPELVVDVIDVRAQVEIQMTLKEFVDHFTVNKRTRLLNMLSLEFSRTDLAKIVEPPHVVSELSLISNCWIPEPEDDIDDEAADSSGGALSIPSVQKYCLLSMAGSYTDFHIDFGGSSVWYHVVWGEKIFYVTFPTTENLSTYWKWLRDPNHRAVFLPDLLCRSGDGVVFFISVHIRFLSPHRFFPGLSSSRPSRPDHTFTIWMDSRCLHSVRLPSLRREFSERTAHPNAVERIPYGTKVGDPTEVSVSKFRKASLVCC